MSEDEEFDMIDVNVSRLQVDNVVIKVPKGWKPTLWDLGEIMPQIEKMRPDTAKTWRPENNSVLPNQWRRLPEGGNPYHIDARRLIEKLPPAYDPEELKEFIEKGTKAWADVPDAAAWVRELRGGKP